MADSPGKKGAEATRRHRRIRRKEEKPEEPPKRTVLQETCTVLLIVGGLFVLLALVSYLRSIYSPLDPAALPQSESTALNLMGPVGGYVSQLLFRWLGWCSFVVPSWAFLLARSVWLGIRKPDGDHAVTVIVPAAGSVILAAACAMTAAVFGGAEGGGHFGLAIASRCIPYVNRAGTILIAGALGVISLGVATGVTPGDVAKIVQTILKWFGRTMVGSWLLSTRVGRVLFRTQVAAGIAVIRGSAAGARAIGKTIAAGARIRRMRGAHHRTGLYYEDDEETIAAPLGRHRKREAHKLLPLLTPEEVPVNAVDTELVSPREAEKPHEVRICRSTREDDEAEEKDEPKGRFALGKKLLKRQMEKKKASHETKRHEKPKAKAEHIFELPPLDLLVKAESNVATAPKDEELLRNSKQLERTLADFRIGGHIVEVQPGPVITLYQFEPAPGIKVQRIVSLADDLALALKVASVRVYAPVPGKGTVGIEVPNAHREIVRLRDILDCPKYSAAESPLSLVLGKDTYGDPYIADLAKMPHLLIAGATGTGKSVCINSILLSLLCRNTPEELRLLMIDPKMLELSVYEKIPHLKAPVVMDPTRARGVLFWAVDEMERRYRIMAEQGVRSVESFNRLVASGCANAPEESKAKEKKVIELEESAVVATVTDSDGVARELGDYVDADGRLIRRGVLEALPRIVIIVDELADLMFAGGRECEELITRLAQKARAAGLHLILATQRPSVDVITGLIKANFPSRISFKVASRIDSRTVLDVQGAEKLLGQGDMLFASPGAGRPRRIHGAFVSDKEVHDVVNWLRRQGEPDYDPKIDEAIERIEQMEKGSTNLPIEDGDYDPLYDQAVNLVVEKGHASTSMVQRVFRIGYNRAARILETMEREGVVGPADGAKPRQVLVPLRDPGIN